MVILLVIHAPLAQFLIFLTWPYAPMAQISYFPHMTSWGLSLDTFCEVLFALKKDLHG